MRAWKFGMLNLGKDGLRHVSLGLSCAVASMDFLASLENMVLRRFTMPTVSLSTIAGSTVLVSVVIEVLVWISAEPSCAKTVTLIGPLAFRGMTGASVS